MQSLFGCKGLGNLVFLEIPWDSCLITHIVRNQFPSHRVFHRPILAPVSDFFDIWLLYIFKPGFEILLYCLIRASGKRPLPDLELCTGVFG
jgi:hypothetical protein